MVREVARVVINDHAGATFLALEQDPDELLLKVSADCGAGVGYETMTPHLLAALRAFLDEAERHMG